LSQVVFGQVQIGGSQVLLQVTSGGRTGDEEHVRRAVQQPRRRDLAPGRAVPRGDLRTDETAVRALGVSLRTYRRRVAELMTALGAASRFQAGARARELGLV
jgi:DNA-binding NarL/FixJ family response regulator